MKANGEADSMISTLDEYDSFIHPYHAAINEINLRLHVLKNYYTREFCHNPIHFVQSRVKTLSSIYGKLERRGYEQNLEQAKNYLTDIAGVRIICYYTKDVYQVVEALHSMKDLAFPRETDYIKNPKPNGYRSYHMIAVVPVQNGVIDYYPVEIQIRTLTMDAWAGMEHQIRYKAQSDGAEDVEAELLKYAETLSNMEAKMSELFEKVNSRST